MAAKSGNTNKIKLSFKEKFELEQLEQEIPRMEVEKAKLEGSLGSGLDHQTLLEMTDRLGTLTALLEEKSMRWLELSEKAEASA
jgi:ATP-binding cassette subfamily F protein uup